MHHKLLQTQTLKEEVLLIIDRKETQQAVQLIGQTRRIWKQCYQLVFTKQDPFATIGSYVITSGKADVVASTQNKYLFNYEKYARSIKQFHVIFDPQIREASDKSWRQNIHHVKNALLQHIQVSYEAEISPIMQSLLLGETKKLKDEFPLWSEIGVVSLFAFSLKFLKQLQRVITRMLGHVPMPEALSAVIILAFIYAGSLLLWRNIAMKQFFIYSTLGCLNHLFRNKKMTSPQRLALSGIFLVGNNPYVIFNQGFIYVFLLRFALFGLSPYIKKLSVFLKVLLLPFLRFFLMLPIMLYQEQGIMFAQVLFYFVLTPLVLPLYFGCILLLCLPQLQWVLQELIIMVDWLTKHLGSLYPLLTWRVSWLFWLQSVSLYGLYFRLLKPNGLRKKATQILLLLIWVVSIHCVNSKIDSIHFLSLPYGEITVIKANGMVYMIDVGGSHKATDNKNQVDTIILPFLQRLHIDSIDYVILTHDDIDHIGDFALLIEQVPVHHVYYNESSLPFATFMSKNANIQYHSVEKPLQIGVLTIFAVYQRDDAVNTNNKSLISYGVFGGKRWLFMGDLEQEGERRLLQVYQSLKIDVLKIGHHGSKTSSSVGFLRQVAPRYAIITVQKRNRHHHPHAAVVERLKEQKITYYNTNEVGSIHYFFGHNHGGFVIE